MFESIYRPQVGDTIIFPDKNHIRLQRVDGYEFYIVVIQDVLGNIRSQPIALGIFNKSVMALDVNPSGIPCRVNTTGTAIDFIKAGNDLFGKSVRVTAGNLHIRRVPVWHDAETLGQVGGVTISACKGIRYTIVQDTIFTYDLVGE